MLIKMELIEAEKGEDFVWQNPFDNRTAYIANTPEATEDENKSWLSIPGEVIAFKVLPGTVFYVRIK